MNDEPDAFGFDADDLGEVLPAPADLSSDRLVATASRCPAMAIRIFDAWGSQVEVSIRS